MNNNIDHPNAPAAKQISAQRLLQIKAEIAKLKQKVDIYNCIYMCIYIYKIVYIYIYIYIYILHTHTHTRTHTHTHTRTHTHTHIHVG
jgi:hypothetical protein